MGLVVLFALPISVADFETAGSGCLLASWLLMPAMFFLAWQERLLYGVILMAVFSISTAYAYGLPVFFSEIKDLDMPVYRRQPLEFQEIVSPRYLLYWAKLFVPGFLSIIALNMAVFSWHGNKRVEVPAEDALEKDAQ